MAALLYSFSCRLNSPRSIAQDGLWNPAFECRQLPAGLWYPATKQQTKTRRKKMLPFLLFRLLPSLNRCWVEKSIVFFVDRVSSRLLLPILPALGVFSRWRRGRSCVKNEGTELWISAKRTFRKGLGRARRFFHPKDLTTDHRFDSS